MLRGLVVDLYGVLTDVGGEIVDGIEPPLVDALKLARAKGIVTALVSNSDALDAQVVRWADLFDAIVLSGQVGVAKPNPGIYLMAAEQLGLIPEQCVFVDDLPENVRGAVQVGMVGIHHTDPRATLDELAILFEIPFG
ncbi:MAG TPA: HAD-IA family hydrolase [Pseudonocardiaceae bacterium]|jgi:epoxide hydrolase-like predicted phosphatase|nr:HAD-IA family hydrolase [Pseudonocardiaceae bacterium]